MNLKKILAKDPTALNDEEKEFIRENAASLSEEQVTKYADVLKGEEEGLDVEAVKALVRKEVNDATDEKKIDEIAESIVAKFMAGAEKMRAKALEAKAEPVDQKVQDRTRKFMKALLNGDKMGAKALTTSTSGSDPDDAQAGLTVPPELLAEVLRIKETQYGIARRDMMYLPFSGPGNSRAIPALGTSVNVFWTEEGGKKKSTQPKFSIVTQTLKKLAAIVPMTEEIIEDSAIDLNALLGALFAEATAKEEDLQFFAGTGAPWTGLLNNGDVNTVDAEDSVISADDLLNLQDATPTGAMDGARYYMHRTWLSVIRKLKDKQGQYIFQAPANGLPGTVWDRPYTLSDAFPAVADVEEGDAFILFGNLKTTCIFGDKQQLRVKLLDQATITDTDDDTIVNLAEQDLVALRVVERVGYTCALPKGLTVLKAVAESESK